MKIEWLQDYYHGVLDTAGYGIKLYKTPENLSNWKDMTNLIAVLITMAFSALLIIGCARHIEKDLSVKKVRKEPARASAVNAKPPESEGSGKQVTTAENEKKGAEEKGLAGVLRKGIKTGVYLFGWMP